MRLNVIFFSEIKSRLIFQLMRQKNFVNASIGCIRGMPYPSSSGLKCEAKQEHTSIADRNFGKTFLLNLFIKLDLIHIFCDSNPDTFCSN